MNSKRILFDARSASGLRITGWERYTRSLLGVLASLPNVAVTATDSRSVASRLYSDWVTLPIQAREYDLVHFPSFPPSHLIPTHKSIVTVHDLTWWLFPETASKMGKHYYKRLTDHANKHGLIATVSESVKDQILLDQPNANVCVIGNIVGLDSVIEEPATLPERPFFLSVGSIEPRKNLHRLAEAFRSSGLAQDFELLLVGRQAWGELPKGVSVTGAVSDGELKSLYKNAQATFVPSFYEGFGLPVAEGLALGSPVFCSDIPVFREVAGPFARYFNPFDVDSIREALIAAAQLGAADRPVARNPYSVERTRKQLEAAYSLAAEVMS